MTRVRRSSSTTTPPCRGPFLAELWYLSVVCEGWISSELMDGLYRLKLEIPNFASINFVRSSTTGTRSEIVAFNVLELVQST